MQGSWVCAITLSVVLYQSFPVGIHESFNFSMQHMTRSNLLYKYISATMSLNVSNFIHTTLNSPITKHIRYIEKDFVLIRIHI